MGSEYFPGRTTPETWVGAAAGKKWEMATKRNGLKKTFYVDDNIRMMIHQKGESDTDTDPLPDEDEYTENEYSESEFHAEQEDDKGSESQKTENQEKSAEQELEETHIEVSQDPPSDFEPESHLLHIDFVADQLTQFSMGPPATRRVATSAKKLPGHQHNISFSRERVREIERTNQILLRRILSTRPTLQTHAGMLRQTKSTGSANVSRVSSAALNRKKALRKIADENEILLKKVNSFGLP